MSYRHSSAVLTVKEVRKTNIKVINLINSREETFPSFDYHCNVYLSTRSLSVNQQSNESLLYNLLNVKSNVFVCSLRKVLSVFIYIILEKKFASCFIQ